MIKMRQIIGSSFAENKDIAKRIRIDQIMPALSKGKEVVIDFDGVSGATQSFIHALISDPIREFRDIAYTNLVFKNANDDVRAIISIVYRYMQESLSGEEGDQN
ncbi:MAG: STAS-like domain-containing protein [Candidatus Woesebacteria bacterium]|jgi:hypothetical protein